MVTSRARRAGVLAAGAAAAGLLATGCAGPGADAVYSLGILEPQFLLPSQCNETGCTEVLDALFLGLMDYDRDSNEPRPTALTESIEGDADNTTWTITLAPGFTFHDGTPVTADSFLTAWNYAAYAPNGQNNAYLFGPQGARIEGYEDVHPRDEDPTDEAVPEPTATTMSGLEKVSDTEFRVTLTEPFSQFPTLLGYTAFYPLPEAAFRSDASVDPAFEEAPIGNGPYRMDGEWQHDQAINTLRYEDFAGPRPSNGGVEFRIYASTEQQWEDLRTDALDVTRTLPDESLEDAQQELGQRYLTQPSSTHQVLMFPASDPAYQDIDVRRAISRAFDRDAIAADVFSDTRSAARSFVSPVVPGFRENTCGEDCAYDPEEARLLWEQADDPPDEVTITFNADGGHEEWVTQVCGQISETLGVACTAVPADTFSGLLDSLGAAYRDDSLSFGPFRVGWTMDYPSMENYLAALYSSDGAANYGGYASEQVDRILAGANDASTAENAVNKYQAAEEEVAADLPAIPMWDANVVAGHSTRVAEVRIDAFDRVEKTAVQVTG